jgi:hypothetical protein
MTKEGVNILLGNLRPKREFNRLTDIWENNIKVDLGDFKLNELTYDWS